MDKRAAALWVWERLLGQPYLWTGDNPLEGFDCSGLVIEGLRAVGVVGRKDDYASFQLAEMWDATTEIKRGCLLFWKRGERIGHVRHLMTVQC
jgi:cell wall-associated NlpC family hydrolase